MSRHRVFRQRSPATVRARKERKWEKNPVRHKVQSCSGKKRWETLDAAEQQAVYLNGLCDGKPAQQGYECSTTEKSDVYNGRMSRGSTV